MCMGVATANSVLVISFARERLDELGDATQAALEAHLAAGTNFEQFFAAAPRLHPERVLVGTEDEINDSSQSHPSPSRRLLFLWREASAPLPAANGSPSRADRR